MRVFETYEEAAAAREEGEVVNGCYIGDDYDQPRYWLGPADATDDECREVAFRIRNGHPMDDYQRMMIDLAKRRQSA